MRKSWKFYINSYILDNFVYNIDFRFDERTLRAIQIWIILYILVIRYVFKRFKKMKFSADFPFSAFPFPRFQWRKFINLVLYYNLWWNFYIFSKNIIRFGWNSIFYFWWNFFGEKLFILVHSLMLSFCNWFEVFVNEKPAPLVYGHI